MFGEPKKRGGGAKNKTKPAGKSKPARKAKRAGKAKPGKAGSMLASQGYAAQRKALSPDNKPAVDKPQAQAKPESFTVKGHWDSFYEWHLVFQGDDLVDSYTDDLPSADWPTEMQKNGDTVTLTQETEAADARITEEMVIKFVSSSDGARKIEVISAKTTYVDYTAEGEESTTIVGGLSAS